MSTTGPAASATSEDVSSATPFESDIAGMFGDFTTSGGESPDPEPTSAGGTTPPEPATGAADETDTPEAAAGDAATTGASAETTSDTPPADATAEADPFAETTPLTFNANGKPYALDGIREFKDGGAVVRPEALADLKQRLSERESLQARNHTQSVEYQTLAKATEWTNPDTNTTYSGPEAAIEMRIGNAALFAENQLLLGVLTDPARLASVLALEDVADGKGGVTQRIVLNPVALESLKTQNELQQLKIAGQIREHFRTVLAEASKSAPAPIDYAAATPTLIDKIATEAKVDASVLTPQDRAMLAKQLPRHVERGQASLEWQELVKERIELRTQQKKDAAQLVTVAAKSAKDGQARMAAAARGVKPHPKPVAPAPKPPSPNAERMADEGALFDAMLSSGAAAMRQAR